MAKCSYLDTVITKAIFKQLRPLISTEMVWKAKIITTVTQTLY